MKPIKFSIHALSYKVKRCFTESEVEDTIRNSEWQDAELGRLECKKDFKYNKIWNRKFYQTKQIKPIFVEEEDDIVVVTVYTYFF
ncbi:MAG: hypothetical protein EPN82_14555 [Bacteroidetes bacterium]|nr:MAG: hypothetical protein EPN82_14555 [Bacteroidota bacterium]